MTALQSSENRAHALCHLAWMAGGGAERCAGWVLLAASAMGHGGGQAAPASAAALAAHLPNERFRYERLYRPLTKRKQDNATRQPITALATKAQLYPCVIEALGRLDGEGLFGRYREGPLNGVLFITAPDADDTETMEHRSARLLNRPEVCRIY